MQQLPSYERYARGPNALAFTMGDVSIYFSYQTIVAFRSPETGLVVRRNEWDPPTGGHLNAIDGGGREAKKERVGSGFFTMLAYALEPADPMRKALAALLVWAIDGNRSGNPYCKPEVNAALEALGATLDLVKGRHDIELADLRNIAGIPQPN